MIKANELRIGNLVMHGSDEPYKVVELYEDSVTIEGLERRSCDGCYNEVSATPLTEEWLLKFGFEKHKNFNMGAESYTLISELIFSYSINIFKMFFKQNNYSNDWIIIENFKCVHQLQNLYFSLTGNELTIK